MDLVAETTGSKVRGWQDHAAWGGGCESLGCVIRRTCRNGTRCCWQPQTIHTLRYLFLPRAGLIVLPDSHATLDVGKSPAVGGRLRYVDQRRQAA